jgi:hypothetical protein
LSGTRKKPRAPQADRSVSKEIMNEHWNYSGKHKDSKGVYWHFAICSYWLDGLDYSDSPIEFYFRDDERTYFGFIRFERKKDNPYKFEKLIQKVMINKEFRQTCEAPETESIWLKSWK